MKRIFAMLLCCIMICGMTACGSGSDVSASDAENTQQSSEISRDLAASLAEAKIYKLIGEEVDTIYKIKYLDYGTADATRKDDHWYFSTAGTFWTAWPDGDLADKYSFSISLNVYDDGDIYVVYDSIDKD